MKINIASVFLVIPQLMLAGCYETSSTQRAYVSAKEECQELATLKTGQIPPMEMDSEKDQQTALVAEFKDCMGKTGWVVTGPDKNKKKTEPVSAVPAAVTVAPLAPPIDTLRIKRAAECAYARQAADNSSNARVIARACEIECQSQRRLSPEAPLPAACAP